MTRKEKIEEAARIYATHPTDTDVTDFHGKWVKETKYNHDEYLGFLKGTEWADENPKSPWISVKDDLPCNHKELICEEDSRFTKYVLIRYIKISNGEMRYKDSMMSKFGSKDWVWTDINTEKWKVTHWMPIPELPKRIGD